MAAWPTARYPLALAATAPTARAFRRNTRLAGQFSDYTIAQLNQFRDGTRKNNQSMADIAGKMNDREIKAVAEYIAGLH